jgi:hypothetical protein
MAKSKGPYFEFVLQKNGASYEFLFLPGNSGNDLFNETVEALISAFDMRYKNSAGDYLRKVELDDNTPSVAVYQTKAVSVFQLILGTRAFRDFKIKVRGLNKDGELKEKIIENPVQAQEAKELIPYFNKNNNDLTTKRRK